MVALERRDGLRLAGLRSHAAMDTSVDDLVDARYLVTEAARVLNGRELTPVEESASDAEADVAAITALYLLRPHTVVEPTAALDAWLLQTAIGDNVPASLFLSDDA